MKKDVKVVLCGYNGFNAYGVLRSLGEAGIYPIIITDNSDCQLLSKSKYAKKDIYKFQHDEEVLKLLRSNFKKNDGKYVLICCEDKLQSLIDKNYNEFKDCFYLSNVNHEEGQITKLMDKNLQMEIAKECGILVPQTWKIEKDCGLPSDIKYPCIIKPELSISGDKSQISICNNEEELQVKIKEGGNFIAQEFIKKDYEISLWGTSLGDDYYIPCICKKIRMFPDEFTLSSFGQLNAIDKFEGFNIESIKRFIERLKYTGMFAIDMMVKNNKYYLLEINLRNGGKQYFSTAIGANLPYLYIKSFEGSSFEVPKLKLPLFYMGEFTDFQQVLRKKVKFADWIKDLFKTRRFFILNFKDPFPFFYLLFFKIKTLICK